MGNASLGHMILAERVVDLAFLQLHSYFSCPLSDGPLKREPYRHPRYDADKCFPLLAFVPYFTTCQLDSGIIHIFFLFPTVSLRRKSVPLYQMSSPARTQMFAYSMYHTSSVSAFLEATPETMPQKA